MNLNQVENGIITYLQNEIAAKAPGPMKFIIYTGSYLGANSIHTILEQYLEHPMAKTLKIVSDDGDIDVDNLYTAMKQAINKIGSFEYLGIKFNEIDVDNLYSYIRRG